jgi:hypothetical protein
MTCFTWIREGNNTEISPKWQNLHGKIYIKPKFWFKWQNSHKIDILLQTQLGHNIQMHCNQVECLHRADTNLTKCSQYSVPPNYLSLQWHIHGHRKMPTKFIITNLYPTTDIFMVHIFSKWIRVQLHWLSYTLRVGVWISRPVAMLRHHLYPRSLQVTLACAEVLYLPHSIYNCLMPASPQKGKSRAWEKANKSQY